MIMRRLDWLAPVLVLAGCGGGSSTPGAPTPAATAPTATPATGTPIGSAGGTLRSADGVAQLVVPAGALAATVSLSLTPLSLPVDAVLVGGTTYQLTPAGTRFGLPARLTITVDPRLAPLGAEASDLVLHVQDAGSWRAVVAEPADAGSVAGAVETAGGYAVRWRIPTGCTAPEDTQFDFWLGTWTLFTNGQPGGINVITKDPGGCVIHESWAGGSGRSVSFRGRDGAWYQTYVQSNTSLRLRGRLAGQRMELLAVDQPDRRVVWEPLGPTRVRYDNERSTDGGATWTVATSQEYRR